MRIQPIRQAGIKTFASLFRFQYHKNFSVVLIGALIFAPVISWALILDLAAQYLFFGLFLYGGIYTVNALSDDARDQRHPEKRHRPIPSGRLTRGQAWAFAFGCWSAAFGLCYLWEGSVRYWPIYGLFIVFNAFYSWMLRTSRLRFLVGLTASLRLHLGAMVAGLVWLPFEAYALAGLFMASVQSLKFRLETREPEVPVGAPLEHLFVISVLAMGVCLLRLSVHPGFPVFLLTTAVSFCVFVVASWIEPRLARVLAGVSLPENPPRGRWLALLTALWQVRDILGIAKYLMLSLLPAIQKLWMPIEDSLFPGIRKVPTDRIVFILGHQRSGTTHLHKCLHRHPDILATPIFELWCPSLVVRWLFGPLRRVLSWVTRMYDSPNHRFTLEEELEEHLWLLHRSKTLAAILLFPSLMRHPELPRLIREMVTYSRDDMRYMRGCIQRAIYARSLAGSLDLDSPHWIYTARPLGMTWQAPRLREIFPESQIVVCARKPADAVASMRQLFSVISKTPIESEEFRHFAQILYDTYSRDTLHAVVSLAEAAEAPREPGTPAQVHLIPFGWWKANTKAELAAVLVFLGVRAVAPEQVLAPRAEHHTPNPNSHTLVTIDDITHGLWQRIRGVRAEQ